MPSHLSSIGFSVASADELAALAERIADGCEAFEVEGGVYLRWSSECGAELWLQVDREGGLVGTNPHLRGESRVSVGVTARLETTPEAPLDGALHCWASPPGDSPAEGAYPFVFDSPDFCAYSRLVLPCFADAQVAAFAHEIQSYATVEAYDTAQTSEHRFASQSFIPSGLFSPRGEASAPPQALALLTGHVLRAASKTNPLTGARFHWAEVETYGGVYDMVVDPSLLPAVPSVGDVVSASCWLSGRLFNASRKRAPGRGR